MPPLAWQHLLKAEAPLWKGLLWAGVRTCNCSNWGKLHCPTRNCFQSEHRKLHGQRSLRGSWGPGHPVSTPLWIFLHAYNLTIITTFLSLNCITSTFLHALQCIAVGSHKLSSADRVTWRTCQPTGVTEGFCCFLCCCYCSTGWYSSGRKTL